MIVTYPLTVQLEYSELKYSLRSIEKYLPACEVLIIGDMIPEWITNVTQIHLPDVPGRKQWSIRRKILAALEYADEILFMNDDIYFLQPATIFPYYFHGMLKNYSESGTQQLVKDLTRLHKPLKHFDGHMPIIYKQDFKEASKHFTEWCIIKSLYCNYFEIEGEFIADCKIFKAANSNDVRNFIKDKSCLSTGMYSVHRALSVLQELFPQKSKYEI